MTSYVLVSASRGYQVVFSLAHKADDKPLSGVFGKNGAFRLVIPKDKRGTRSIRMLEKLEFTQVRK